jgi:cell division protein FtsL
MNKQISVCLLILVVLCGILMFTRGKQNQIIVSEYDMLIDKYIQENGKLEKIYLQQKIVIKNYEDIDEVQCDIIAELESKLADAAIEKREIIKSYSEVLER